MFSRVYKYFLMLQTLFVIDKVGCSVYNDSGNLIRHRGIAQLVEQRSPKPRAEGSSPSAPAMDKALKHLVSRLFSLF